MNKSLINVSILLCILFATGCTTITRGTKDTLVIETDPPGAEIEISNGLRGKTPASFKMSRKEEVVVKITKEGYQPVEVNVNSQMVTAGGAGMAGNVLIGGVIGMGVDAATGATNDLKPNPIKVTLEKIGGVSDDSAGRVSTRARLEELEKLFADEIITDEEYQQKRVEILEGL